MVTGVLRADAELLTDIRVPKQLVEVEIVIPQSDVAPSTRAAIALRRRATVRRVVPALPARFGPRRRAATSSMSIYACAANRFNEAFAPRCATARDWECRTRAADDFAWTR